MESTKFETLVGIYKMWVRLWITGMKLKIRNYYYQVWPKFHLSYWLKLKTSILPFPPLITRKASRIASLVGEVESTKVQVQTLKVLLVLIGSKACMNISTCLVLIFFLFLFFISIIFYILFLVFNKMIFNFIFLWYIDIF